MGGVANLTGLIIGQEARRAQRSVSRGLRTLAALRASVPDRLVLAPQDIRTADPTIAADIYAGHLVFGGSFVDAHGRSPFDIEPPSLAWAEGLHGFGWLRHLRAADTALTRVNARALVEDWINHCDRRRQGLAWQPHVVSRRLLSWLAQSPVILSTADGAFYRRFMRSVGRQASFLHQSLLTGLRGEDRLFAALALAECGLCADGMSAVRKLGTRVLSEEITRQILPDGGHISRNPAVLVTLLLDTLPLRQAFAARSAPVPEPLVNAIDRMMPMLRLFRTGEGSLAHFNGMGVTEPDLLSTLLAYDDAQAKPLTNAPHSGYQRLQGAETVVVCDFAKPPPRGYSDKAHAGTLSFELSSGLQRIVVNCGRPSSHARTLTDAARSTAAHSTLVVADTSSSRFATPRLDRWLGQRIIAGPTKVDVSRDGNPGWAIVMASHDGYGPEFGLIHRRRLQLALAGDRLLGEDRLHPIAGRKSSAAVAFDIRFHLAPGIQTRISHDRQHVELALADGQRWVFSAGGLPVALDESVYFAAIEGPRRTSQIVVSASFPDANTVAWSLTRQALSTITDVPRPDEP